MLDPSRYSLDAATVGFRKRMKQSVDMASFDRALQSQTESIKVRRELKETPITEIHVMGGGMYGIANDDKTNTYARQQRQINGYVLRSFKANAGPIILPPKHGEGLMATPMNMGQRQYGGYNSVVGNYVSSFTEPLQAPLDNNTILLGRAGIAAANESASNPYARLQFLMNMNLTQQQINQNQAEILQSRQYNVQNDMKKAIRDAEVEQFTGRKRSAVMRQIEERGNMPPPEAYVQEQEVQAKSTRRSPSRAPLGKISTNVPKNRRERRQFLQGIPWETLDPSFGMISHEKEGGVYEGPTVTLQGTMAAREAKAEELQKQGVEIRGASITQSVDGIGNANEIQSQAEKSILADDLRDQSADQKVAQTALIAKTGTLLVPSGPFTPVASQATIPYQSMQAYGTPPIDLFGAAQQGNVQLATPAFGNTKASAADIKSPTLGMTKNQKRAYYRKMSTKIGGVKL